jgi:hypothetical protein
MGIGNKRWKAGLMVILIFVLGFATGALTANLMSTASEEQLPPRRRHEDSEWLMKRLTEELHLAPEQSEAIHQILAETGEEYRRLRQEIRPRFREIRNQSRERIRAVLNPEQREKYEELVRRHDEMLKKRFQQKN